MKRLFFTCMLALVAFTAQAQLVITEIMYNPPEAGADSLEYIELYNNSSTTIDLNGYTFTQGVTHTFNSSITLAPGTYAVVAIDSQAVVNNFGINPIAQWTSGALSNGGEDIAIGDNLGNTLDSVNYDDAWIAATDGNGPSLVRCDPALNANLASSWQASTSSTGITINGNLLIGSPGSNDLACGTTATPSLSFSSPSVAVSEAGGSTSVDVNISAAGSSDVTVEVVFDAANSTADANDHSFTTTTLTFPAGSTTAQTVTLPIVDDTNVEPTEDIILKLRNESANAAIGIDSSFTVTIIDNDVSAPASDIVITEIMYNPPEAGSDSLEFIELYNNTAATIDLNGYSFSEGVTHTFTTSILLPAGAYAVVAVDSQVIVNNFGVSPIAQWTSGGLSNGGEDIVLVDPSGNTVDSVDYDDAWAPTTDGSGPSLVRCDPLSDGNDGANWQASSSNSGVVINGNALLGSPNTVDVVCSLPTVPEFSFISSGASVSEGVGTAILDVAIANPDPNNPMTVDVIFDAASSTADASDHGFSDTTLTFAAGTSANQTLIISIVDDMMQEMDENAVLKLRNVSNNASIGIDSVFILTIEDNDAVPNPVSGIVITEIMYNLPSADTAEYIELYNNTAAAIDLMGVEFTQGVSYEFMQSTTLNAGAYFVITSDTASFSALYGVQADAEWTSGATSNGGEDIVLIDNTGAVIDSVDYSDGGAWPAAADGDGPSLVLCDPSSDNADPANWSLSSSTTFLTINTDTLFVSPGADDAACQSLPSSTFSQASYAVDEDGDSVVVSIELSNAINSTSYVTVDLATTGTAVLGTDFNYTPTTVVFPAGTTGPQTVTIDIIDDAAPLGDVTIDLELTNGFSGAQAISTAISTTTITIEDDETLNTEELSGQLARLYPNPAKQRVIVETTQVVERLQLTNNLGQVLRVVENPTSNRLELNVADLVPGMYQITVQTEAGLETQSFIKQ